MNNSFILTSERIASQPLFTLSSSNNFAYIYKMYKKNKKANVVCKNVNSMVARAAMPLTNIKCSHSLQSS
jgi:hypothetical protein